MELLAEKQAQLPKFQRKLYGPTTLEGVQTLVGNPNELCNFLLTQIPKDMVFQGEIFHKHSYFGEQKIILMIRVDSDEFQSRWTHIPIVTATKKRKSSKLNYHMDLPGETLIGWLAGRDTRRRGSDLAWPWPRTETSSERVC